MSTTSLTQHPASRPAIVLDHVTKEFHLRHTHSMKETAMARIKHKPISADFLALDDVSFTIDEGESVALLGLNGSGKSTSLKLVSGVLLPTKGQVLTRGRVAGLIEVGAGFHPDLSGRENVFLNAAILGMSREETEARFDDIVAFSEIGQFIDTEVKHYSSGMFVRLAFAVAIHTQMDTLLVDEVLSVGDEPFQKKCFAKIQELQQQGKTLMVVSHDLETVQRICQRGIVMSHGQVVFDGPIEGAVEVLRQVTFADVPEDHPQHDAIVWLSRKGITTGWAMPGGTREFRPDNQLSREAIAAFLQRLAQKGYGRIPIQADESAISFSDVPAEAPFESAIRWAAARLPSALNVSSRFRPQAPLTRQEFRAILHAFGGQRGDAVARALFHDDEPHVTRAEMAEAFYRYAGSPPIRSI
ncbi:ABC-type polysaccharide/polyol phosphate transport system ATPase subunit [Pseudoclavibacter caeni]|uniref:ATP-binding cassette domain-containing protein n=1 Tax=Pseudoclavibacter caeni TaxID=908846 RepID=A0A7C8FY33_9MICO|nr:ATP-binding cassette domain-containing protein [Pseudoclavibacter caeni]NYJ96344.1 ABC-type polysaccharide/polyol phosphate transport system ATPase subunit [Pseudoclavibacter caeni]